MLGFTEEWPFLYKVGTLTSHQSIFHVFYTDNALRMDRSSPISITMINTTTKFGEAITFHFPSFWQALISHNCYWLLISWHGEIYWTDERDCIFLHRLDQDPNQKDAPCSSRARPWGNKLFLTVLLKAHHKILPSPHNHMTKDCSNRFWHCRHTHITRASPGSRHMHDRITWPTDTYIWSYVARTHQPMHTFSALRGLETLSHLKYQLKAQLEEGLACLIKVPKDFKKGEKMTK